MSLLSYFRCSVCVLLLIVGCGPSTNDPGSNNVLFQQIEGGVEDMNVNVSSKNYSGDLGDDRVGMAVAELQKSVAGTPLEEDVKKLANKYTEVSTLASKRPKMDKLRSAVKELSAVVAEVKKKM